MRVREILLLLLISGIAGKGYTQENEIGVSYGKFYAIYKFKDDGTGFRNVPKSQYSGYPSVNFNMKFTNRVSAEFIGSFLAYQQYTGTRLYSPGFFSIYYSGNISLTCNYSIISINQFECRLKAGLAIGFVPDKYQGRFIELFSNGSSYDSISRGIIRRDYTSMFPTICSGIDFSYRFSKGFKVALGFTTQTGFYKITEYDIYYADGSGINDQHAVQWGNGSFYAFQAGIRYILKNRKK